MPHMRVRNGGNDNDTSGAEAQGHKRKAKDKGKKWLYHKVTGGGDVIRGVWT